MLAEEYNRLTEMIKVYMTGLERNHASSSTSYIDDELHEGHGEEKDDVGVIAPISADADLLALYEPLLAASPLKFTTTSSKHAGTTTAMLFDDGIVFTGDEDSFYTSAAQTFAPDFAPGPGIVWTPRLGMGQPLLLRPASGHCCRV